MSEASPAIIGSIVGAYFFALFGCGGTVLWLMRLNKTTAAPIYTMEKTAEPLSMPTSLPGVGDLTGLADKIPGGNPLNVANSVTGGKFPVPALGGKDIPGLSSIPDVTGGKIPIPDVTGGKIPIPGEAADLTGLASDKMLSNIEMSTFSKGNNPVTAMAGNKANAVIAEQNKKIPTVGGGGKKTKGRRTKLTKEAKVKKPRTKKCLIEKDNKMYMSFCI